MKEFLVAIVIAGALIGGAIFFVYSGNTSADVSDANYMQANNVQVIDGRQVVDLRARGGYTPRKSVAKAGMPTVLKIETSGTFDCSSSIRVPSLNISKNLPSTGSTEIDLGTPKLGLLRGSCGMGMYPFEIDFQS